MTQFMERIRMVERREALQPEWERGLNMHTDTLCCVHDVHKSNIS